MNVSMNELRTSRTFLLIRPPSRRIKTMPLITQWVKDRFSATASVYITREIAVSEIPRASCCPDHSEIMPSYKSASRKSETHSPERGGDQTNPLTIRLPSFARYNLWPRPKSHQPLEPTTPE